MVDLRCRAVAAGFAAIVWWMLAAGMAAAAADECKNRGQLDTLYCDDNNDLVADVPSDPKKLKDPSTIVFAYTPVEDPAVYQNVFKPFTDFLAQCTGKRVEEAKRATAAAATGNEAVARFRRGDHGGNDV